MKKSLAFFVFILSFAAPILKAQTPAGTDGWILDKTLSQVDFYHKLKACNGDNAVLLKFNNRNPFNVTVAWNELFFDSRLGEKIEGFQGQKRFVLLPGETAQPDCNPTRCTQCLILPEQVILTHKADIQQFEFKDITVIPAP